MIRYEFVRDSMDKFFFQQLLSSRLVRLAPLAIMVNIFMLFDAIADGNRSFFAPSNSIYSWSFCMFKISFVNVPVQVLTASHCFWCRPSQRLVSNEICGMRVVYQFLYPQYCARIRWLVLWGEWSLTPPHTILSLSHCHTLHCLKRYSINGIKGSYKIDKANKRWVASI